PEDARLAQHPQAGLDRRVGDAVTRLQGHQDGRTAGRQARDAGRPRRARDRRGAQPAAREGRRPGPEERVRRSAGGSLVAAPKAPLLGASAKKDVALEESVFAAEVKPHVVHETVRAELNADRRGTRAAKSRGLVAGGRSKPWRQKGTGRARAGTTRAPHWTGGGAAFQPRTQFGLKVNRRVRRSALRGALSSHATNGTFAILDAATFDAPSTKRAAELLASWGKEAPVVVVATDGDENVVKSFRNLERVVVTAPGELEVAAVVWARSLLVTERALEGVRGRAAAQPPVRAERGPVEGAGGNREVPSTRTAGS